MAGANVLEINDLNFDTEVLKSAVPFLLDFSATWCGPCKVLSPIVDRLADEFQGKVRVGKLDIDDSPRGQREQVRDPRRPDGPRIQERSRIRSSRGSDEQGDVDQASGRVTSSVAAPVDTSGHVQQRRARMSRFLRILVAITAVIHLPVALGVGELARRLGWPYPALVGAGWGLAGVVLFVGRARAGMPDRRNRNQLVVRLFDIPYFIHWCASVWTLVPAIVATLLVPLIELLRGQAVGLPVTGYMDMYLSGLVVCGYGVLVRRRWVKVAEHDVPVVGLDPRLDGLRIAQLSDLHIGTLSPLSWGLRWARLANDRAPDVAVVTGDMVTSGTEFHGDVAEVLGALRAKSGVFASMGNHDYFGEGEPLVTLLRARGVTVLRNEGVVIERSGAEAVARRDRRHLDAPGRRPARDARLPRGRDLGPARTRPEPVRRRRGRGRQRGPQRAHARRSDRGPVPRSVREPGFVRLPVQRRLLPARSLGALRPRGAGNDGAADPHRGRAGGCDPGSSRGLTSTSTSRPRPARAFAREHNVG